MARKKADTEVEVEVTVDVDAMDDQSVQQADNAAVSRLEENPAPEEADPEIADSNIVDLPRRSRARTRRRPPANLAEPLVELGAILRNVSFGKSITNVTGTLGFELDVPAELDHLMGEHAYAVVFRGDFLGEGLMLKDVSATTDAENRLKKKFKLTVPRWNNGTDQLERYMEPLLPDGVVVDGLFELSTSWRLNVTVEIGGRLALHEMQQSFDLTARAADEPGGETYEPLEQG